MTSSHRLRLAGLLVVACAASGPARSAEVRAGDLVVEQPWARATPGGASPGEAPSGAGAAMPGMDMR